ncbi:hypothetical protein M378DRAFT_9148 [Amanita muscaria Koide BX008]|uniref:Uncharacterized protein n=1 Tax=Amanita muscaria (strain Koide BX008) TaxID=946122 RepID=A0A0C2SWN5_AMAMK|nr:hypothetical protein M378DRAFT_9148 [Amanita muscaria Koide BX008]
MRIEPQTREGQLAEPKQLIQENIRCNESCRSVHDVRSEPDDQQSAGVAELVKHVKVLQRSMQKLKAENAMLRDGRKEQRDLLKILKEFHKQRSEDIKSLLEGASDTRSSSDLPIAIHGSKDGTTRT